MAAEIAETVKKYDINEPLKRGKEFTEEEFRLILSKYFAGNKFIRNEIEEEYGPIGSYILCSSVVDLSNLAPKLLDSELTKEEKDTTIKFNGPIIWNLDRVKYFRYTFAGMTEFNQPVSHLDFRNMIDMDSCFLNCRSFNQPVTFNTHSLRNAKRMFMCCRSFNSTVDIHMQNVNNSRYMFMGCSVFNQNVSHFNVSTLVDAHRMFMDCSEYNQPLDWIGVSGNLIDTSEMFLNCTKLNNPIFIDGSEKLNSENMFPGIIGDYDISNYDSVDIEKAVINTSKYNTFVSPKITLSITERLINNIEQRFQSEMYNYDKLICVLDPLSEERTMLFQHKEEKMKNYKEEINKLKEIQEKNDRLCRSFIDRNSVSLQSDYKKYMINKYRNLT